jgi:hypothetical protein
VIKTNKPLSDLDDDELLHLPSAPARMKGAVYATKLGKSIASWRLRGLGLAVGQPMFGPLSDRFGRPPVLRSSLTLYTIASASRRTGAGRP